MRPRPPPRDEGVSTVLGAVLVFGLLVVTLVTVQVQFVPRWEEDREARHMDALAAQLALFKADVERLATNATGGTITDPLSLETRGGFGFFRGGSGDLGATAGFEPSATGAGLQVATPQLRIQVRDGEELFGLDEDWLTIPSDGEVGNIERVRHLRVRVGLIPGTYDDGDSATLTVRDADGDFAGSAVVTFRDFPSEQGLQVQVFNAANQEISSDIEAFFQQTQVDYFYIDLMDRELLFRDVLAVTETPFTLDLSNDGLDADYTVVYRDTSGGTGGGSTGGFLVSNYDSTLPSGALTIASRNQHLPDQTFVLEHGALLVVQDDGEAMLSPPSLSFSASSTTLVVDWVVAGLDGSSRSLGGARSLNLQAHAEGDRTDVEGMAANLTLVIPTDHPGAWEGFLADALESAGLSSAGAQPEFAITATASQVEVQLYGPVSDPLDTTEDITLRFQQSTIDLDLDPSG